MKHGQQRLRAGAAQSLSDRVTTWLFLLPALAVVVVAVVIPLGNSFILSFQRVRINVPDFEPVFLGLENYRRMFSDPLFIRSVQNTMLFAFVTVFFELVLGVMFAMMLSGDGRGARIMRSIMLVPMIMAPVAAGTMWRMMLDKNTGIVNYLFTLVGMPAVDWLGNPVLAMVSIMMVDIWRMTPWFSILLISGIKSIPGDTIEAALVDGANRLQCFWRVVLPQMARVLCLVLMLRLIDAFKVFDIVFVMTGGHGYRDAAQLHLLSGTALFRCGLRCGAGSGVHRGYVGVVRCIHGGAQAHRARLKGAISNDVPQKKIRRSERHAHQFSGKADQVGVREPVRITGGVPTVLVVHKRH